MANGFFIGTTRGIGYGNNIGNLYEHGLGVPQDFDQALRWYRQAYLAGNATAANNIGTCYQHGRGVPVDYAEALRWYHLADEGGNAGAAYNIGYLYQYGHGVTQDLTEARRWIERSAAQGDPLAQQWLERMKTAAQRENTRPGEAP